MKTRFESVALKNAQPHYESLRSYSKKDLTNLLIVLKFSGKLLEPVKGVRRNGKIHIFDGLSRYFAALQLGWESIDVEILDLTDEEVKEQLVLRNFRTKRSLIEVCDKVGTLLGILGSSQGKKREAIGSLEMSDEEFGSVGKDRVELAAAVAGINLSASTLRRLLAVNDFEKAGDEEVKGLGLMDKLERNLITPSKAYNLMKTYLEEKQTQGENPVTEGLDYYKGNHYQLFNKTCEDLSDVPDESISLTTVSTPYYGQRDYPDGVLPEGVIPHGAESTPDEFVKKQVQVAMGIYAKTKPDGSYVMVIADSYEGKHCLVTQKLIIAMVEAGWYFNDEWIWKKNQKPQSVNNRLLPNYERILHFTKHPTDFYFREFKHWLEGQKYGLIRSSNDGNMGGKKERGWSLKRPLERFRTFLDEQHVAGIIESSVFNWKELEDVDSKFRHLAPFPSYIPVLPILMCSKVGDTIMDVYSGTGTTAAVALQLGRNAIGFDTDTKSHEFAHKRLDLVEQNLHSIKDITDFENDYMEAA